MDADTIIGRLRKGWDDHQAVTRPLWCPEWRWLAEQRLGYGVARAIQEMRSEGHTWAFIGAQFGVHKETVRRLYHHGKR